MLSRILPSCCTCLLPSVCPLNFRAPLYTTGAADLGLHGFGVFMDSSAFSLQLVLQASKQETRLSFSYLFFCCPWLLALCAVVVVVCLLLQQ
jgi:hypothetical protein